MPFTKYNSAIYFILLFLFGYNCNIVKNNTGNLNKKDFDKEINGIQNTLYTLKNRNGMTATFTNWGARLVTLHVKDKRGAMVNVVAGLKNIAAYEADRSFLGATVGRFANRISNAHFFLDGEKYQLPENDGKNTLHGGRNGFDRRIWHGSQLSNSVLVFNRTSKDMEEGFPGDVAIKITYTLKEENTLRVEYEAAANKKTIINISNHSYFNLNGQGEGSILNHLLQINADNFTPVDETLIPTGEITPVQNTPFDFSTKVYTIGSRINEDHPQLKYGKGYDINYVLHNKKSNEAMRAATVVGDKSGIQMDIFTTQPGIQFYSGNFMDGKRLLNNGKKDDYRTAFALEPQNFPDAPNQPSFPSAVIEPGEVYHQVADYKFSVRKNFLQ